MEVQDSSDKKGPKDNKRHHPKDGAQNRGDKKRKHGKRSQEEGEPKTRQEQEKQWER